MVTLHRQFEEEACASAVRVFKIDGAAHALDDRLCGVARSGRGRDREHSVRRASTNPKVSLPVENHIVVDHDFRACADGRRPAAPERIRPVSKRDRISDALLAAGKLRTDVFAAGALRTANVLTPGRQLARRQCVAAPCRHGLPTPARPDLPLNLPLSTGHLGTARNATGHVVVDVAEFPEWC